MRKNRVTISTTLFMIYLSAFLVSHFCDETLFGADFDPTLTIVQSDENQLLLEFNSPKFILSTKTIEENSFQVIEIPGCFQTSLPGKPQLPIKGCVFGIPPGATVQIEILDSKYNTFSNCRIYTTPEILIDPQLSEDANNPLNYNVKYQQTQFPKLNEYFPTNIYEVEDTAFIRDQRIGRLTIHPIQYNSASGEIRWYKKLKIKLKFKSTSASGNYKTQPEPNTIFDKILNTSLINYEQAKYWQHSAKTGSINLAKNNVYGSEQTETWYKIVIVEDGFYQIGKADLESAGINISGLIPQNIKIYNKGAEIAIFIAGEQDSIFGSTDYIEFYGSSEKSRFTNENIYWMTFGEGAGLRMQFRDVSLDGQFHPIVTKYTCTKHFEENLIYEPQIPNGANEDHWFWHMINGFETKTIDFSLKDVYNVSSYPCYLTIELRGLSYLSISPDHHVIVSLNGNKIMDLTWDGKTKLLNKKTFIQGFLKEGINQLTISLPADLGAEIDKIVLNHFEIEFWRNFVASNNFFNFAGRTEPGAHQFEVKKFTDPRIKLFDVTNLSNVNKLINFKIDSIGALYHLKFLDSLSTRFYYSLTPEHFKKPKSIVKDEFSQLKSINNQADYIIITPKIFIDNLAPLANLRENQGINVFTVCIDDIYDEFNHGIKSPIAIKEFLSHAYYRWRKPAPTYVLLVGDSSYDFKNYLTAGYPDILPTYLFESNTLNTEVSSDNWFVCVSGNDVLPDMLIGRLPARTTAQIDNMTNKIIGYEIDPVVGEWNKNILLVSDNADYAGDFEQVSDYFDKNYIPDNFNVSKVYLRDYSSRTDVANAIIEKINQGCLITNYIGHGSPEAWAAEKIMQPENFHGLYNGKKLPIVITMCCMNGFFHHATIAECLPEVFLDKVYAGAIAVITPSGFQFTLADQYLGEGMFSAMFSEQDNILGSTFTKAKISMFAGGESLWDHVDFFNLLGDPALTINIPNHSIQVETEWNLISLPRLPSSTRVDSVLSSINGNWQKLMAYSKGTWAGADAEIPSMFWTLNEMKVGQGYWLQTQAQGKIDFKGSEKSSSVKLTTGWNLIGYPIQFSQPVAEGLSSIQGNWSKLLYYSKNEWIGADADLPEAFWTLQNLECGAGYWLKMTNDDTLNFSRVPVYFQQTEAPNNQLVQQANVSLHSPTSNFQILDKNVSLHHNYELSVPLPSGFYGQITVRKEPAPVGTKISAWINEQNFLSSFLIPKPGIYNLLLVGGDQNDTPTIEGGKLHDLITFKIVLPSGEELVSDTKGLWEEGINRRLDLFALSTPDSTHLPLKFEFQVNNRTVGNDIIDGDPIPANSTITILIHGNNINLNSDNIELFLNTAKLEKDQFLFIPEAGQTSLKGKIIFQLKNISDGIYNFKIETVHPSMMPNVLTDEFSFRISSTLQLEKIVNFPNPMQQDTKFTYYLVNDGPAEIAIKIYTAAGRLIKVIDSISNQVGYNETYWDGRDNYGDEIANGVYFYKILAKDGSQKIEAIEKLIKMR